MLKTRRLATYLLLAWFALACFGTTAYAWGPYGHLAIADHAAEQLNLSPREREYFVLGALMGDLDKSNRTRRMVQGRLRQFLATVGHSYQFDDLVNFHDKALLHALLEEALSRNEAWLDAWALGVLGHRRADLFIDTYPVISARVQTDFEEAGMDVRVFRRIRSGRYKSMLRRIERTNAVVYSHERDIPWTWWFFGRSRSLKRGVDHDRDVERVDRFAELTLSAHRRAFLNAALAPRSVSDIWRQQAAYDALLWNYRWKVRWYPGLRDFLKRQDPAWFQQVETIALVETAGAVAAETRAWQLYFAARRAGQQPTPPRLD